MGELADTYGFYPVLRGDSDAALKTVPNEGGESLLVGDMAEVWIFHIMRWLPKVLFRVITANPFISVALQTRPSYPAATAARGRSGARRGWRMTSSWLWPT